MKVKDARLITVREGLLDTEQIDMGQVVGAVEDLFDGAIAEAWRLARDGEWTEQEARPHIERAVMLSAAASHIRSLLDVEQPMAELEAGKGEWGAFVERIAGSLVKQEV